MKKSFSFLFTVLGLMILTVFANERINAAEEDTIRTLIISECRLSHMSHAYVELANVGDEPINLSSFELGCFDPWEVPYAPSDINTLMLPDIILQPGETWLVSNFREHRDSIWFDGNRTYRDVRDIADLLVDVSETTGNPEDSIAPEDYRGLLEFWTGRDVPYLEFHIGTDSTIVDAVNNAIDPQTNRVPSGPRDVAGIPNATNTHVLVRKANVKHGNTNWEDARGNDIGDSEWIPIPFRHQIWDPTARYFTTIKFHGDAHLNEESVSSSTIDIDWDNHKMTVPWAMYLDSIMDEFELGGGIAWHINYGPDPADSVFNTTRAGDSLTFYALGNTLETVKFGLEVAPPTEDVALVFPKRKKSIEGDWFNPFYVTENEPDMDSIGYIPFATRVDTLEKYLEKAPEASWEFIWEDGKQRVDLKRGDILRVTAENGTVKDYYLAVDSVPDLNDDAHLAAITWPDVPVYLKEDPQWHDDTIPGFKSLIYSYIITVPYDIKTVPALVPHPVDINAKITVKRAKSIIGKVVDRTTTFTVTAQDDSTILKYNVLFKQELPPDLDQPFIAEPFISQVVFREWWGNNYVEICNPGNRPLDLSKYMFAMGYPGTNPADIITGNLATDSWTSRYMKYIPGYDWQDQENWTLQPGIAVKDLAVTPSVGPGEVFVIGRVETNDATRQPSTGLCDVIINRDPNNAVYDIDELGVPLKVTNSDPSNISWNICMNWWDQNRSLCLYKILNDSIREGSKPVGDPADFELIDLFGDFAGTTWSPGSDTIIGQEWNIRAKSHVWYGDTVPNGTFAATDEESNWEVFNITDYTDMGYGYPDDQNMLADGIGAHPMDPISVYISTITANIYTVEDGYESPLFIKNIISGTTASEFLGEIFPGTEGQTIELLSGVDNSPKTGDDPVASDDTLKVVSPDGQNTTRYYLVVDDQPLSDDAVIASEGDMYTIDIINNEGTLAGFEFGTTIAEVLNNVILPEGAVINVIDENDNLVPLSMKNFDTISVPTIATSEIYFEVIAENKTTIITYKLIPNLNESDALLYSNVYGVNQDLNLVSLIPDNTTVTTLFTYLKPNAGATAKVIDKLGFERTTGYVAFDDEIVVTSPDGTVERTYTMSFLKDEVGRVAYAISAVYLVDQAEMTIQGIPDGTSVEVFLGNVEPANYATMMVVDADGNEVTSGNITEDMRLKVTSGNEELVVHYALDLVLSVNGLRMFDFGVYPNPTTGVVFIEGLQEGSTVEVRDLSGKVLDIIPMRQISDGTISLESKEAGTYLITIRNGQYSSKTVKVIKR